MSDLSLSDDKLWTWLAARLGSLVIEYVEDGNNFVGWCWRVEYKRSSDGALLDVCGPYASTPREALRLAMIQEEKEHDYIYEG